MKLCSSVVIKMVSRYSNSFFIKCSKHNSRKYWNIQLVVKSPRRYEYLQKYLERENKNGIDMLFSCDKYDNIRRKAFNDINEVDHINFQTGSNVG